MSADVNTKRRPTTDDPIRSYTMSRIRNKDTSIEVSLRKALWKAGIRYRKNYAKLPGTPDIAITKHKIAIFCDGEFWHGKDWEKTKNKIQSNREYWIKKIERNIDRDIEVNRKVCGNGWTVVRFWGTEIRKNLSGCVEEIQDIIFQNKIDSQNIKLMTCPLYPCWLHGADNENKTAKPDPLHCETKAFPCFESAFESLCKNT